MTPELIERLNLYITLDDNKEELNFSGLMSEIAMLMNGDDVTIYQPYGSIKGYFIKNVPAGGAFSESTTIDFELQKNKISCQSIRKTCVCGIDWSI